MDKIVTNSDDRLFSLGEALVSVLVMGVELVRVRSGARFERNELMTHHEGDLVSGVARVRNALRRS
jgi:hypothetical protein